VGAERAQLVVDLQRTLMRAVAEFGDDAAFVPHRARVLATAAALDYVLMVVTGSAGARIPADDGERAVREGIARAVDDLIAVAKTAAAMGTPAGSAFARRSAKTLVAITRAENLANDERTFALIALSNP
jgi:hypothetical protein